MHPAHTCFAGDAVHTDLCKECAKGCLATVGLGITLVDRAFDGEGAVLGEFWQIGAAIVGSGYAVLQGQVAFFYAHGLGNLFAQRLACNKD